MASPHYGRTNAEHPEVRKLHKYHAEHAPVEFYTPRPDGTVIVWNEFGELLGVLTPADVNEAGELVDIRTSDVNEISVELDRA